MKGNLTFYSSVPTNMGKGTLTPGKLVSMLSFIRTSYTIQTCGDFHRSIYSKAPWRRVAKWNKGRAADSIEGHAYQGKAPKGKKFRSLYARLI